jgi:hypothetical protein
MIPPKWFYALLRILLLTYIARGVPYFLIVFSGTYCPVAVYLFVTALMHPALNAISSGS